MTCEHCERAITGELARLERRHPDPRGSGRRQPVPGAGRQWMTHCHNVYHEQSGMMGVIGYVT